MVMPPEQVLEAAHAVVITEDIRITANRIAHQLQAALRAHGYVITEQPDASCSEHVCAPLCCDTADQLLAGLQALRTRGDQ